jgi:hypothetical protein
LAFLCRNAGVAVVPRYFILRRHDLWHIASQHRTVVHAMLQVLLLPDRTRAVARWLAGRLGRYLLCSVT